VSFSDNALQIVETHQGSEILDTHIIISKCMAEKILFSFSIKEENYSVCKEVMAIIKTTL